MPRHEIPSALLEAYEEKRMKAFNAKLEPLLAASATAAGSSAASGVIGLTVRESDAHACAAALNERWQHGSGGGGHLQRWTFLRRCPRQDHHLHVTRRGFWVVLRVASVERHLGVSKGIPSSRPGQVDDGTLRGTPRGRQSVPGYEGSCLKGLPGALWASQIVPRWRARPSPSWRSTYRPRIL